MNDVVYNSPSAGLRQLGSLVNGEIDRMIVVSHGQSDVYDITFVSGNTVSLSFMYHLLVAKQTNEAINISLIKEGDIILYKGNSHESVAKITKRTGNNIVFPPRLLLLNNIYVYCGTPPSPAFVDPSQQLRKDTCKFRSDEMVTKAIRTSCCASPTNITEYECKLLKVLLMQPRCWNCEFYQSKI